MSILDTITQYKKQEVAALKKQQSITALRSTEFFNRTCISMAGRLMQADATGIIAEFKRQWPSKGIINAHADVAEVTAAYTRHRASGLSVLTDEKFFGGNRHDFYLARANANALLRKDFIVDEYQLVESKAMGADVILLIAACLSPMQVQEYAAQAAELGMEVLLELHSEQELKHVCMEATMVGINNRNLKTFEVNVAQALHLSRQLPADKIRIAESGIKSAAQLRSFKQNGYKGFLMGEHFMQTANPGEAFAAFVAQLNEL